MYSMTGTFIRVHLQFMYLLKQIQKVGYKLVYEINKYLKRNKTELKLIL